MYSELKKKQSEAHIVDWGFEGGFGFMSNWEIKKKEKQDIKKNSIVIIVMLSKKLVVLEFRDLSKRKLIVKIKRKDS